MKVSLNGLYRFLQLKTGDVTYMELDQIPDPEERLYITQLLMQLSKNLQTESDLDRVERMLDELVAHQELSLIDALERLVMLL